MISIDNIPVSLLKTLVDAGVYPLRATANGMGFYNENVLIYMIDDKGLYYGTTAINDDFKESVYTKYQTLNN